MDILIDIVYYINIADASVHEHHLTNVVFQDGASFKYYIQYTVV